MDSTIYVTIKVVVHHDETDSPDEVAALIAQECDYSVSMSDDYDVKVVETELLNVSTTCND